MVEQIAHSSASFAGEGDRDPVEGQNPTRIQRRDGWTPARIRTFLYALRDGKNVTAAAAAAGMSRQSAYKFRRSAGGEQFDRAWRTAQELARRTRLAGVMDAIVAKRLRRLQRLVGPRYVVEIARAKEGQGDPDGMLWSR